MFLRGFNLDHGTDFSTAIDGMPPTCAATVTGRAIPTSTLIPETIARINFVKGPYHAELGIFRAAQRLRPRMSSVISSGGRRANTVFIAGSPWAV